MLGKKKPAFRPLFSKRRHVFHIPLSWIIVGVLVLLLWIVPATHLPATVMDKPTPFGKDYTPPPSKTPPPKPTAVHGGRIVFTCTRGDYNQLCIINADGTELQQLSSQEVANDYYPVFSPRGNQLMFASNRNGTFDIYLMVFGQRELFQITDHIGNVISPDFSPDGQKIVFANRAADGPTSIWMVNTNGSHPHLVYAGPNMIVAVAWSPDGQTLAYAMQVNLLSQYQIFLMDVDGTNSRQLTNGMQGIGGSVAWSPDGKSLLIYAGPVGGRDIFRLDVATGALTQLTDGGNNAAPCYSPDGKFIVFNSLRNNGQADLYIMNADGSNQRQLTDNPEPDWQPRWEP